ncbi:MAG: hydantoinase/oxoprolinase N-terminal domain-containing protein, partial [Alphaproteobacteria bacterium]
MRYLSADVGGTFTDLVLIDGATGTVRLDKVPSTPGSAEAVGRGIARLTAAAGLGAADIGLFVHGFTIATNALLTRTGARIALIVTEGFRDVLEIGPQMRPKLYALTQTKPPPVVPRSRVVEVAERIDAFGAVVVPLAIDEAVRAAEAVAAMNPEAVAVCLAFAHLATDHERMIEAALHRRLPGVPVYLSCRVNPQIEEYPRANTTAIAAYVGPVVDRYVGALEATLGRIGVAAPLRLMR